MSLPKRIVVTGAARGIGRAIAENLLAAGCEVLLIDRDAERLAATTSALAEAHAGRASSHRLDLADAGAILDDFARHPWCREGLDGLVNNAAIESNLLFPAIPLELIEQTWRINMRAPLLMTQVCLPALERNRGAVVNLSSVAPRRPYPTYSLYASTKAFLDCFTRHVATELGPRGVRINNVSPGGVQTELMDEVNAARGISPEALKAFTDEIPMEGRWGRPEEVAECVAFALFGPRYLHGETICVDGAVYR